MLGYFATIGLAVALTLASVFGVYNYLPLKYLEIFPVENKFGATITTINATDTLKDSRAVINTNFSNLNDGKIENSTSSVAAITTLSNLVSVGTLTTGTWNATTIGVAYGGTGSTTLSSNQVLLGNGTGAIKVVSGLGSSGQVLKSNGAGSAPTWQSASTDESLNYNWTGLHDFGGATTTISSATTTFNGTNPIVGISTTTPGGIKTGLVVATSTYIEGGLGIGIATTSENNVQIAGDLQLSGKCSGCNTTSTTTASATLNTANGSQTTVTATCPTGQRALSGGWRRELATAGSIMWVPYENLMTSTTTWAVSVNCVNAGGCDTGQKLYVDLMCTEDR